MSPDRRIPAPAGLPQIKGEMIRPDPPKGETLASCLTLAGEWLARPQWQYRTEDLATVAALLRTAGAELAVLEDQHLELIDRHDALMAEWDERGQRIAELERDLATAEKSRDQLLLRDLPPSHEATP